ncbi:hypothetical protein ABEX29_01045 [Brevibacillus porteri]|uniref:hypothetical protein n=1 Tax=Brevibacillus porteri TaxID=2126350 RepID=UPI003D1D742F
MAEITHSVDTIYFKFENADKLGVTDYNEELYKKITAVSWSKNGKYIRSNKLKTSLHQYVMAYWYGEEELDKAKKEGFIVEHHNNDGFDCRISNLSFAPEDQNKAKAFTYDKMRKDLMQSIAINFYKDFETGRYQITLGFNKPHWIIDRSQKKNIEVTAIYLLYNDDFFRTLNDATNILHEMKQYRQFKLSSLRYEEIHYTEAIYTLLDEDTPEDQVFFIGEDGQVVVRLGTPHLIITQIGENKDLYKKKDS